MRLRRRLERVAQALGRQSLEEDRRQREELGAWLRTLSDEELAAVAREARRRCEQEGGDADA
jgi:hypothetical protein